MIALWNHHLPFYPWEKVLQFASLSLDFSFFSLSWLPHTKRSILKFQNTLPDDVSQPNHGKLRYSHQPSWPISSRALYLLLRLTPSNSPKYNGPDLKEALHSIIPLEFIERRLEQSLFTWDCNLFSHFPKNGGMKNPILLHWQRLVETKEKPSWLHYLGVGKPIKIIYGVSHQNPQPAEKPLNYHHHSLRYHKWMKGLCREQKMTSLKGVR